MVCLFSSVLIHSTKGCDKSLSSDDRSLRDAVQKDVGCASGFSERSPSLIHALHTEYRNGSAQLGCHAGCDHSLAWGSYGDSPAPTSWSGKRKTTAPTSSINPCDPGNNPVQNAPNAKLHHQLRFHTITTTLSSPLSSSSLRRNVTGGGL